jgi:outer membrane receptor for ferric coprogen and ferric-rhodotorulic acid
MFQQGQPQYRSDMMGMAEKTHAPRHTGRKAGNPIAAVYSNLPALVSNHVDAMADPHRHLSRTLLFAALLGALALPALAASEAAEADATESATAETTTLDDVVVTATKQARSAFETPASVDVIEGETLQRQHQDTLGDVA